MTKVKVVSVGPLGTNCYLLIDESLGRGVIIDPGGEPLKILSAIQKIGRPTITHILLTHGHADHIAAAPELQESLAALIVVHKKDEPMLKNDIASLGRLFGVRHNPISADLAIEEGWKGTIHTPGHTPGSVCFHLPDSGILFSGDTLFADGVGRTDLPGGNHDALLSSLRKLSKLPPATVVYPGHGPKTVLAESPACARLQQ